MEQDLNSLILAWFSTVRYIQQRQNLYNTGYGSQKHYTEIMNWERGDYNQVKGKTLEPSDYEVFGFFFFPIPA